MSATDPLDNPDPRTPVVVGVGQSSERIEDAGYRRRSPVELAADAAREALTDTGADATAVATAVDTIAGTRQFENSVPGARAPLGRSDNFPRSVAGRIGASPRRAILEVSGGQSPQHLVNELAATIAAGERRSRSSSAPRPSRRRRLSRRPRTGPTGPSTSTGTWRTAGTGWRACCRCTRPRTA